MKRVGKDPQKIGIDNNMIIIRHGPHIIHAHNREVRKFRRGITSEIPWFEIDGKEEQMMTNDERNNQGNNGDNIFVNQMHIDRKKQTKSDMAL